MIALECITNSGYSTVKIYHNGFICLNKYDEHFCSLTVEINFKENLYNYYKAQYFVSKGILPNNLERQSEEKTRAITGKILRKFINQLKNIELRIIG